MTSKLRQLQRASSPRSTSPTSTHEVLPTELAADRQTRIAALSLIYAAVYTVAWGLPVAFGELFGPGPVQSVDGVPLAEIFAAHPPVGIGAGVLSILGPLAFYFRARRAGLTEQGICGAGMMLVVLGAFGIAIAEQWGLMFLPSDVPIFGISWVAFWILLFPLLVPTFPKRALIGSVAAALMPLAAFGVHHLGGAPKRSLPDLALYFAPNFISAFAATLASKFVYRLGSDASKARKLGSYELGEQLGVGGMGEVWSAQHELLKRPAAVKVIRPERLNTSGGEGAEVILLQPTFRPNS